jgi:hypothetical protein
VRCAVEGETDALESGCRAVERSNRGILLDVPSAGAAKWQTHRTQNAAGVTP